MTGCRMAPVTTSAWVGLTCDDWERLWVRANGCCEICDSPPVGHKGLQIDHDHKTASSGVRGLLCPGCNSRIARVDNGHREPTERQSAYLANPFWHTSTGAPIH